MKPTLKTNRTFPISNILWWEYYKRAITIYQIHSPFLFLFLNQLTPLIRSSPRMPNHYSENDWWLHRWIYPLSEIFDIHQVIDYRGGLTATRKIEKTAGSNREINIHTRTGTIESSMEKGGDFNLPEFKEIRWLDGKWENGNLPSVWSTTPAIGLFTDIHSSRVKYQEWLDILDSQEFQFSVELYNLGILLWNPVVNQTKQVTFIPWQWKPWKILTI